MVAESLTQSLKSEARRLGFALVGVCPAVTPAGLGRFDEWLRRGYAGEMEYLGRRREAYATPSSILPGARSLVMLATPYLTGEPRQSKPGMGRVSRYAWSGVDYHDVIRERMKWLIRFLRQQSPDSRFRATIDTAPLLEREFASLAGLGWQAKNTLLLNKSLGSWFFLSALLSDVELDYDAPNEADHCGTCTACLDACPTAAFVQPNLLDANRCISYLTIEHRSAIATELRPLMGDWVFGCDVCQDVCPWNRKPEPTHDPSFEASAELDPLDLCELFFLSEDQFRLRFGKTPLARARRRGLLRNAAIVLGNQRATSAIAGLAKGLDDVEPIVRGACAWALGQLATVDAKSALSDRLAKELDADVRAEIDSSLGRHPAITT